MLNKIYILLTHYDLKDAETFVEEMKVAGFSVKVGAGLDGSLGDIKHSSSESILITDDEMIKERLSQFSLQLPVIGYGRNFGGRTDFLAEEFEAISIQYMKMVYARFFQEPLTIAQTDRILIREITLGDLPSLYELYATLSDCEYIKSLNEWKQEEEFEKQYIKNMYGFYQYGLWLVFRKEDGRLIGRAGIENRIVDGENVQEIGYLIGKPYQRHGYAYEACQKIMQYAFEELYMERLFICTHKTNIPSIALADRLGFSLYRGDIDGNNLYLCNNFYL